MNVAPFTYIDLFAGVSGLGLGLEIAVPTAQCVCHVEIELYASEVLAARAAESSLADAPQWSDIRTFDGRPWRGAVDCIIGGFPCQDISVAGKRAGISGKRSGLWGEYARLVEEIQPQFVFVENVGGLSSSLTLLHRSDILEHFDAIRSAATDAKERWYAEHHIERLYRRLLPIYGISALLYVQCCLGALGYESEAGFFTASEVGASHKRERVFILAWRAGARLPVLMADSASGGCGIMRQSPGGDGLTDRRNSKLADRNGSRNPAINTSAGNGRQDAIGGSDQLVNAPRHERPGSHRQAGPRRGIREAGDGMDDAERSERRTVDEAGGCRIEGRDRERQAPGGTGESGQILGHADQPGLQRRIERGHSGNQRAARAAGDPRVEDADLRESKFDARARRARSGDASGARSHTESRRSSSDEELADADSKDGGRESNPSQFEGREGRRTASGWTSESLPLFAPGPGATELWQDLLVRYPWMRPAISQAEAQFILLRVAPGTSIQLDFEDRTDRLRSLGNLAQSLQAAVAFTVLARRVGIIDG